MAASHDDDLTHFLPPGFSHKRKRNTVSKDVFSEVRTQFDRLYDASLLTGTNSCIQDEIKEKIRALLVAQCKQFLLSCEININENKILNLLQRKTNEHDSDDFDRVAKRMKTMTGSKLKEAERSGHYNCKECGMIFKDYRGLGGHMAWHNSQNQSKISDKKKRYHCRLCNREFDTIQALGGHIAGHKRKGRGEQGGAACGEESESSGEKVYECNICLEKFSSGQALGGHKTSHRKIASPATQESCGHEETCSSVDNSGISGQALGGRKTSHGQIDTPSATQESCGHALPTSLVLILI